MKKYKRIEIINSKGFNFRKEVSFGAAIRRRCMEKNSTVLCYRQLTQL